MVTKTLHIQTALLEENLKKWKEGIFYGYSLG